MVLVLWQLTETGHDEAQMFVQKPRPHTQGGCLRSLNRCGSRSMYGATARIGAASG